MGTAEAKLERQVKRLLEQQRAIVELARRHAEYAENVDAGLCAITEVAARVVGVSRASVWMLNEDHTELRCLDLFEADKGTHSSGVVLYARDYPGYFAALESGRAIDAHDARADARTVEFRDGYLVPLGITSMMDAAVREEGHVEGVVCHEHVGDARSWTPDEVSFAGALSDQVSLILGAAARRRIADEREKMREQLLHVQKLESVGLLAGGVAHDFNNLLATILANVGFARRTLGDDHAAREPLDDAILASKRATQLTRQLLAFSGMGRTSKEPIDVATQVREIGELLSSTKSKKVRVTFDFEPRLPPIEADPGQFQQVIMNMILNAAEAIGDRSGEIAVSARLGELTRAEMERLFLSDGVRPGPIVIVRIADTGPGISKENLGKVFDPFFSTKGKGRGLGLSAVIGIIRGNHAGLRVESEVGKGTAFDILFEPKPGAVVKAELPLVEAPRGDGVVLVVDDEPAIGRVARRVLTAQGYRVLSAASGRAGLTVLAANADVSVVLLDLTMPDLSGSDVLREMKVMGRSVKVVLMSGYDEQQVLESAGGESVTAFLPKPFTPEQLVDAVGSVARGIGRDVKLA
ncbi:MAG: response regulator [Deltaproteobacteria bacterium]|nr:response regulator [Deltaproteobacteria bacterium]